MCRQCARGGCASLEMGEGGFLALCFLSPFHTRVEGLGVQGLGVLGF